MSIVRTIANYADDAVMAIAANGDDVARAVASNGDDLARAVTSKGIINLTGDEVSQVGNFMREYSRKPTPQLKEQILSVFTPHIEKAAASSGSVGVSVQDYSQNLYLQLFESLDDACRKQNPVDEILGKLNGTVEEIVTSYRSVVAYNMQDATVEKFCENSDHLTKAGIRTSCFRGVMGPILNCIGNIGFVIIALFGGIFAVNGLISVGVISAFIVYARQFSRPVNEIAQIFGQVQTALAGAERVFIILDEKDEDKIYKPKKQSAPINGPVTKICDIPVSEYAITEYIQKNGGSQFVVCGDILKSEIVEKPTFKIFEGIINDGTDSILINSFIHQNNPTYGKFIEENCSAVPR